MNIRKRKYVVQVFGRTYSVSLFEFVLACCFHAYKDALCSKKGSPKSNFRLIGSYVSVL